MSYTPRLLAKTPLRLLVWCEGHEKMAKRWDVLTDQEREEFLAWLQPNLLPGIQAKSRSVTPNRLRLLNHHLAESMLTSHTIGGPSVGSSQYLGR